MKTFFITVVMLTCLSSMAQDYNKALGIKFPGAVSVSYKKFVSTYNNIEAEAMFAEKGFRPVVLYEFNFEVPNAVEGLRWFVGPGLHLDFWKDHYQKEYDHNVDFGIDFIIGLDYKFYGLPLNVSLDWQPAIQITGSETIQAAYGGLGIRFTF